MLLPDAITADLARERTLMTSRAKWLRSRLIPAALRCYLCGLEKPLSEFYRHPSNTLGVRGKCKACAREYERRRNVHERMAREAGRSKRPA